MAAFIVTLAALLFARGLAFAVSDEGNRIFHIDERLAVIGLGQVRIVGLRVPIVIAGWRSSSAGWSSTGRATAWRSRRSAGTRRRLGLMGLPIARVKTTMYLVSGLLAGLAGTSGRRSVVVRPIDDRRRARAAGDRGRRDRRHAVDRRLRVDPGDVGRGPAAERDQQRDQSGRDPQLVLPAGRQRRLPDRCRPHPALLESGAAAMNTHPLRTTTARASATFLPVSSLFLSQANKSWSRVLDDFQMAEELGFDHAWLVDHLVDTDGPPENGCLEGWTLLSAIAAKTSRIRMGSSFRVTRFRHPALLLKEAVTVDHVSDGRLILGASGRAGTRMSIGAMDRPAGAGGAVRTVSKRRWKSSARSCVRNGRPSRGASIDWTTPGSTAPDPASAHPHPHRGASAPDVADRCPICRSVG